VVVDIVVIVRWWLKLFVMCRWVQYRWSRADSMFTLTNTKGIMIGGGESVSDNVYVLQVSEGIRCVCAPGAAMIAWV